MQVNAEGGDSAQAAAAPDRTGGYWTAVDLAGPLLAAATFGAAEQWLSLQRSPFLAALGGMTAPWLVLPFLVGASFRRRRGHVPLGLACAWLAVGACSAEAPTGGDFAGGHLTPDGSRSTS